METRFYPYHSPSLVVQIMSSNKSTTYYIDDGPDHLDPSQYEVSQPGPELKFFMISNPAEAKTPSNKKLVRSHVARTSHAKSRHAKSSGRDFKGAESSAQAAMDNMQLEFDTMTADYAIDPALGSAPSSSSSAVTYQTQLSPQTASFSSTNYGNHGAPTSFIGQLSPWEQYLLDHCKSNHCAGRSLPLRPPRAKYSCHADVNVFIPNRHNPCDHPKHNIDVALYRQGMTVHWVSFCLTDIGLFKGIMLTACRSLSKLQRHMKHAEMYEQRALQYRGECLRHASETMPGVGQPVGDNAIAMSGHLAFTEVGSGHVLLMSPRRDP